MKPVPDSALVRDARDRARTDLSPAVYAHSERAFHLGALAGDALGVAYDAELLYVAAVLHDLGFAGEPERNRSFETVGADAARDLAAHDASRAHDVWRAILFHTVPHVARAYGAEALLVHLGSAADAFGAPLPIDAAAVARINEAFPRGAIGAEITAVTLRHAAVHPFGQLAAFRALGLVPAV